MNEIGLQWSKLDWKDFQKLSLFLFREINGDPSIEEFLRQGHFQSGIDLLSFKQETGKHICIQCKHTNLSLSKLKEIVSLFMAGEFVETTETFILSTTSQLQIPAIQNWLTKQKIFLRANHGIAFDVWDRQRLEDSLVDHYRLVEKYFGNGEAKTHCFQPAFLTPKLSPVAGFITRHIQLFKDEIAEDKWHENDSPRSTLTLADLLAVPGENKRFFLIAEAYEGKSSLFQQVAWELSQLDLGLVPLVLDLKFCSVQPVIYLLNINFGSWPDIPAKDLILLIDGLDEVPAEQFDIVVSHIRDFQKEHPFVRLAVSCRKMFYKYQNLSSELRSFDAYELLGLHMRQIFDHLEPPLGGTDKAMNFYREMNSLGIADLLGIPFYLIHLTKWFSEPGLQMPKNKMAIANRFVDESLSISSARKLRFGLSLDKYKIKYRNGLQQFALLLQIKGLNACHSDDLQELFLQEDIDLLTHSSILHIRGSQWSFINAVFQEQLAALALQKLDVKTVISLVTLGNKIRKVSRKWIQTLATYLSIFPEEDKDREQIVAVIEEDNIELLALSEGSKFNHEFRQEVLKKILARIVRHQARLIVIDESDLAAFSGNNDFVVDELLRVLNSDAAIIVKIVSCRTLRYLSLSSLQAARYTKIAKEILIKIENADLGRLLLEAIAHYKHGDDVFLSLFFGNPLLTNEYELRQGLYKYLLAHDLVDRNYDWLLSSFNPLKQYNLETLHLNSEKRLFNLVLSTRDRRLMSSLLEVVKTKSFQEQFRDDKDGTKEFYKSLVEACAEIYSNDPLMIFSVVDFLLATGRGNYDRQVNGMTAFLELTQTHSIALKIALLSPDKEALQKYAFSGALHPSCYDVLIYAIEENYIDQAGFKIFCNGLYYIGKREEALKLEQIAAQIFGFIDKPDPKAEAYHNADERKRKNDLHFISSQVAFRTAINQLFEIAGKSTIKTNTLYGRFDEENPRNALNSSFLTQFIIDWSEEKTATLDNCLRAIDDEYQFKVWRADRLFKGYLKSYYPDEILQMLKAYYEKEIICFPFADISMDSSLLLRHQAGQLMKIWAEYQWQTNDSVLLEFSRINTERYGGIHFAKINKRKSVNSLLVNYFSDYRQLLKMKVLQNLNSDLKSYQVIGSQFELCRELNITEALPFILDAIKSKKFESHHEDDYMTLYISLGGDHAELLPIFQALNDFNNHLFLFMAKLLEKHFPAIISERLLNCLQSNDITEGRKIEAAQRLAQLGNKDGFLYLIGKLEAGKNAPFEVQSKISLWNVDTQWGLEQLRPLMFIILDEKTDQMRFYNSPKYLLLEILGGFAGKGEIDLDRVTTFMEGCAEDLSIEFPKNSGHLSWHAEQITERYRQISVVPLKNREIKKLFQQIDDY